MGLGVARVASGVGRPRGPFGLASQNGKSTSISLQRSAARTGAASAAYRLSSRMRRTTSSCFQAMSGVKPTLLPLVDQCWPPCRASSKASDRVVDTAAHLHTTRPALPTSTPRKAAPSLRHDGRPLGRLGLLPASDMSSGPTTLSRVSIVQTHIHGFDAASTPC